jgi:hypothetical protein
MHVTSRSEDLIICHYPFSLIGLHQYQSLRLSVELTTSIEKLVVILGLGGPAAPPSGRPRN